MWLQHLCQLLYKLLKLQLKWYSYPLRPPTPPVILTSLTGASQVASPRAVADIAIPALPADAVVLAGVGQALFGWLFGARGFYPHCPLGLSQPPNVFALPIYKQVSDAAHITIVQQSCPHLRKSVEKFHWMRHRMLPLKRFSLFKCQYIFRLPTILLINWLFLPNLHLVI